MQNNIIKSFSIQEIVNTISREDFNAFLTKFLSTTNIEKMNEILNILYERVKDEATKAQKKIVYKNAYQYMMMLLYNEAISIDHAIEDLRNKDPENGDALIQHNFSIGDRTEIIEETFTIDKDLDLSKGSGTISLYFDRTPRSAGNVEILIKDIYLVNNDSKTHTNLLNDGNIYPDQYNVNKTYASELTEDGYKLTFTATKGSPSWDRFLVDFDKSQKYKSLTVKFKVIKSETRLDTCLFQFNDWTFKEYYAKLCGFGSKNGNAIYRDYFVRDYIVNIYHHRSDILSYKDIDNIKEEFSRIWDLLEDEEKDATRTLMRLINGTAITHNACPANFYKFFTRINDESAECEKNIELLSYILNKDSYSLAKSDIAFIPNEYDGSIESSVLLSLLLKIKETTINY